MIMKDYKLIAKVLRNSFEQSINPNLNSFVRDLTHELKMDNPRFDREKFLETVYEE